MRINKKQIRGNSSFEPKAKVDLKSGILPGQICSNIQLLLQDLTVVKTWEVTYAQVLCQVRGTPQIKRLKRRLLQNPKIL